MLRAAIVVIVICAALSACGRASSSSALSPYGTPGASPGQTLVETRNTSRVPGQDAISDAAGAAASVFTATSDSTRPQAVVLADKDNWQGQVAAAALSSSPLSAPILLSDGASIPPPTNAALNALNPPGAQATGGAQVIRIANAPSPSGKRALPLGTGDQYQQAVDIDRFSQALHGRPSGNVIIASGEQAAWAMPAAAWAARSGDAVLFASRDTLPQNTKAAIASHGKPNIYILGPTSVISNAVQQQLQALGPVARIQSPDPVSNSVAFARYSSGPFGWAATVPGFNFTIANTNRPGDAAAAATLGSNGVFAPLLLTDNSTLPQSLEGYFLDIQPGYRDDPSKGVYNHVWILGDESSLSRGSQGRVDEITELVPVHLGSPPAAAP